MVPLLDLEKMLEMYTVWALRGPPHGPHGGHEYHLKTYYPLPLRMNSAKFD